FLSNLKSEQGNWETFCRELKLSAQDPSGLELLLKTEVVVFDDGPSSRSHVEIFAEFLILGDPSDVVLRLADFLVSRMGKPIHVDEIREFLQETSFQLRNLVFSPHITDVIEQCRKEYQGSVQRFLIDGQIIPRPETEAILQGIL